jgi:hypothetical protein
MHPHKCMLFTVISSSLSITLLNSMQEWSPLHTAAELGDNNYIKHEIIYKGFSANTSISRSY